METTNPATKRQDIAVEYDPRVLEAVHAHVREGFECTAPAGVETGGVLFGTHSRRKVTVTAMRPASCMYSSGPVFVLGPQDHQSFQEVVSLHQTDPALHGLEPVGWFLSHVRDSLVLRPSDRDIFDRYFDQTWQVVLVIRPGRVGSLRAATMARGEPEETVLNEFSIRQAADWQPPPPAVNFNASEPVSLAVRVRPSVEALVKRPPIARAPAGPILKPIEAVPRPAPLQLTAAQAPSGARQKRKWPAWISACGILAIAALATALYPYFDGAGIPLGLAAVERDGIMCVEWNPNSRLVRRAARADLVITDGDQRRVVDLGKAELNRGLFVTLRKQSDVIARIRLYDTSGMIHQELARYAGRPVAKEGENRTAIETLENENTNLHRQLDEERQRADDLQRQLRMFQKRRNR